MQHLYSCTGILGDKTPPFLMVRREIVCNIRSHALKLGWVNSPLLKFRSEVDLMLNPALEFEWEDSPHANGKERSIVKHLKSCTEVWVCKTLPLADGKERSGLQYLKSCTGFLAE